MPLDHSSQVQRSPMREHRGDCYDTPPEAVYALLKVEKLPHTIWEPACGTGNIVKVLREVGHKVVATDLNARGCPESACGIDFLMPMFKSGGLWQEVGWANDYAIVTNPPFSLAQEFVEIARTRAAFVIMLLRFNFYESVRREHLFRSGLAHIHVFSRRLPMMHREGWEGRKANSGMAFAWFVWHRDHKGPTTISRVDWKAI